MVRAPAVELPPFAIVEFTKIVPAPAIVIVRAVALVPEFMVTSELNIREPPATLDQVKLPPKFDTAVLNVWTWVELFVRPPLSIVRRLLVEFMV